MLSILKYACFVLIIYSCTNQYLSEAQRQISINNFDEAIPLLKTHLNKNITDSEAWYSLGQCYAEIGDYKRMNSAFKISVKNDPQKKYRCDLLINKHLQKYLNLIKSNMAIYESYQNNSSKDAQELAAKITDCIEIALKIKPNSSLIPVFNPLYMAITNPKNNMNFKDEFDLLLDRSLDQPDINKVSNISLKKSNMAIIGLIGNNITDGTLSAISNRLFHKIFQKNTFTLLEREKMEEILKEQAFQMSGCISSECLIDAGKLLNVELILSGSISKVTDFYMIDLRIIDVENGEIVLTVNEDIQGDFQSFITNGIPRVVDKLTSSARK